LIFVIKQRSDDATPFKRAGNDLVLLKEISIVQALTGFSFYLKHLDDNEYLISHKDNEVIQPDEVRVVRGLGMPVKKNPMAYGNLIIKFVVVFPKTKLAPKDREALKKMFPEAEAKASGAKVDSSPHYTERYDEHEHQRNATSNSDSDGEDGQQAGQRVQCAQQ